MGLRETIRTPGILFLDAGSTIITRRSGCDIRRCADHVAIAMIDHLCARYNLQIVTLSAGIEHMADLPLVMWTLGMRSVFAECWHTPTRSDRHHGKEIEAWLDLQEGHSKWIILGGDPGRLSPMQERRHIATDPDNGIMLQHLHHAEGILHEIGAGL